MLFVAISILVLGSLALYDAKSKSVTHEDPYDPRRLRIPLRSTQLRVIAAESHHDQ